MKKIYYLVLGLGLLYGCSGPAKKLKTSFNSESEGMVVGTICLEKKMYNIFSFYYCDDKPSINNYPNLQDSFTYRNSVGDFNKKGNVYYLFSVTKPAGKYKFFKIKIYNNMRNDPNIIEIPVDMKFEVEKGKTTYFGEMHINAKTRKTSVNNEIERDRQWFAKKLPTVKF